MASYGLANVGQKHCAGRGLEPERLEKQKKSREAKQVAREQSRAVPRRRWADPAGPGGVQAGLCLRAEGAVEALQQHEQVPFLSTSCLLLGGGRMRGARVQQRVLGLLWQCRGQGWLDSQGPCVFLCRRPILRQSLCSSYCSSLGSYLRPTEPRQAG